MTQVRKKERGYEEQPKKLNAISNVQQIPAKNNMGISDDYIYKVVLKDL